MGFLTLLVVAGGASFAVVYLLTYVPLISKKMLYKGYWSPRLFITNKILGYFDAGVTFFLVCGSWLGFTSALGISAITYNVLSGIGISCGVVVTQKYFSPRWTKQYENKILEYNTIKKEEILI